MCMIQNDQLYQIYWPKMVKCLDKISSSYKKINFISFITSANNFCGLFFSLVITFISLVIIHFPMEIVILYLLKRSQLNFWADTVQLWQVAIGLTEMRWVVDVVIAAADWRRFCDADRWRGLDVDVCSYWRNSMLKSDCRCGSYWVDGGGGDCRFDGFYDRNCVCMDLLW